jgi:hypothetical protein
MARHEVTPGKRYPDLEWILDELTVNNPYPFFDAVILGAAVVGSEARGKAKKRSDLDIAVILDPESIIIQDTGENFDGSSIQLSSWYHGNFTFQEEYPVWHDGVAMRSVDFQFFYPGEIEAQNLDYIMLGGSI